jgi:hypothetical protein
MARKDDTALLAWTIGLGTVVLAGVGIYFYEKSQSQAAAAVTPPGGLVVNAPSGQTILTQAQIAQAAAAIDGTTLAAWQASGVPAAQWADLPAITQQALTAQGVHANAT